MSCHDLAPVLNEILCSDRKNVLVIGDVMLDKYVHCDASRLSPEGPVPVLLHRREDRMLGGAGNVARNIASLGQAVHLVSLVGQDEAADSIAHIAGSTHNLKTDFVVDTNWPTTQKCRFVADRQQVMRYDIETSSSPSQEARLVINDKLVGLMEWADIIVISDYSKGVVDRQLVKSIVDIASELGKKTIVDPKSSDPRLYYGVTGLTPNLKELARFAGHQLDSDTEIEEAARNICTLSGTDFVVVTLGPRGALIVEKDAPSQIIPTEAREVFDVSGAGDTFISGLAVALSFGWPVRVSVQLGNLLAGVAVGQIGTATVSLKSALKLTGHLSIGEEKDADNCLQKVKSLQGAGFCIGFTNGCFDILHSGHVKLLNEARAQCDFLVVGVNSDESVRRLKGDSRPVKSAQERSFLLSQLASVDAVIIFDEDDPGSLIERLVPDILIKGADYELSDIVGASTVIENGGRVYRVKLSEGYSTTATIEKILTSRASTDASL